MKTASWKRLLSLLLALCMVFALAACGSSSEDTEEAEEEEEVTEETEEEEEEATDEEDLQTKWASLAGTSITVGTTGAQTGWSQDDGSGGLEGMDIDVMTYICDYYGIELEWVVAESAGLWGMIQTGEIDTIACLTTTNADRLDTYWFTNTYAWESYVICSRTEDGIPEDGDLSFWDGKTIAGVAGTNSILILEDLIAEQAEEGVTIEELPLSESAVLIPAVVQYQADGAFMTASTAAYTIEVNGYSADLTLQDVQYKNMPIVYAFAREEENQDLILAINDLIEEMYADGTLADYAEKWFGRDVTALPDGEVNYVVTTGDDAWQSYEN